MALFLPVVPCRRHGLVTGRRVAGSAMAQSWPLANA